MKAFDSFFGKGMECADCGKMKTFSRYWAVRKNLKARNVLRCDAICPECTAKLDGEKIASATRKRINEVRSARSARRDDLAPGEWREYVNNRLWLDSAKRVISRHEAGEPWPKWARPVEELEAEVADMELHLLEQREKRPEMYNRFEWEYVEAQNP